MLSGLWQRSRRRSGFFGVKGPFLVIFIEQPQHALCVALQNDPWIVRYPIIGELYAAKITVADTVAKEFRHFFSVNFGQIQNNAAFRRLLSCIQKKIIHQPIVFGQNAGSNGGMT